MSWHERVLDEGTDRERWLAARQTVLGASDFAKLAKPESADKYLAAKLAPATFTGNEYTEQGHRWEPMMLAWADITPNVALIHSPGEKGFAATPDGADDARGAECKVKHARVVDGPSAADAAAAGSWSETYSAAYKKLRDIYEGKFKSDFESKYAEVARVTNAEAIELLGRMIDPREAAAA